MNENPFCQCGCGERVSNLKNKYILYHVQRGVVQSEETKNKRKKTIKNKRTIEGNLNNPLCQCGCGQHVIKKNNKYVWGHNPTLMSQEGKEKLRNKMLGKTYEEIYGEKKADEVKKKLWKNRLHEPPVIKGKTWEDYYGKEKADSMRKILSEKNTNNLILKDRHGPKNPAYKGHKDCLYSHWSSKLQVDKNRENINGRIEVECKYCGRWFTPTCIELDNRINELRRGGSGSNFYCSKHCKNLCSDFYQVLWPKNYKPYDHKVGTTEVMPEVRKNVFERDKWECQKCGKITELECHHIDPVSQEPFFANDPDSCITLCKNCHKEVHMKIEGCKYYELRTKC